LSGATATALTCKSAWRLPTLGASQQSGQAPGNDDATVSGRIPGVWRVRDRLTDEDVQSLISDFLSGTSKQIGSGRSEPVAGRPRIDEGADVGFLRVTVTGN